MTDLKKEKKWSSSLLIEARIQDNRSPSHSTTYWASSEFHRSLIGKVSNQESNQTLKSPLVFTIATMALSSLANISWNRVGVAGS
jgi:hypothetical protein